jgi:hypothetical protein
MNELTEVCNRIRNLNENIFLLREKIRTLLQNSASDLEIGVFEDEMNELEKMLETEQCRHNKLREELELKEYQDSCIHSFIEDLIDIDLDRSKIVKYCVHCLFTNEN